jgi:heat shock protein HslJ
MRRSSVLGTVLLVGLLAFVLAGCGSDTGGSGGAGGGLASSLDGRRFLADDVSIEFRDGTVSASAGCNLVSGDYRIEGGSLVVDDLAMTEMACPGRDDRDAWLVGLLSSRPVVALDGDQLTLSTESESVVLLDRRVVDPDRPLVGTRWELTTIVDGDAASSVPAVVEVPWIELGEDGEARWYDGCNWGGASVEIVDGEMRIGEGEQTTRGCVDAAATVVSEGFGRVVGPGATTFEIDGPALHLQRGDAALGFSAP